MPKCQSSLYFSDKCIFTQSAQNRLYKKVTLHCVIFLRYKLMMHNPFYKPYVVLFCRYPMTLDEFYRSRLPNTFEEERAGKRMKLPVPETWETQVSLKGNKASTWEQLLG